VSEYQRRGRQVLEKPPDTVSYPSKRLILKAVNGAFPETRLVLEKALEKAVYCPLFHINVRQLSQKLKFWESLNKFAVTRF
jgi:hypothetical protein